MSKKYDDIIYIYIYIITIWWSWRRHFLFLSFCTFHQQNQHGSTMLQHSNLAGSTWNVWHLGFWQWRSTFHRLRLQGWDGAVSSKDCRSDFVNVASSPHSTSQWKGKPSNSDLQVEQSNGAPDDYYICNWTAPEWRALTPQSILPNSPPSLFKTCCVDHLSNCQLADLWFVLIVPTYKVIVAVVHNTVLYWVAMWNKLVPWQQHGGIRQILLLINNWGNSDQTFELHLIEVYIIPNSGRSPNLLGPFLGYGELVHLGTKVQHGMIPGNVIFVKILGFDEKEWMS